MDTIGAYAFVTSDWKENDFPFDLWIKHAIKIFDQIAIVTYGEVIFPDIRYEGKLLTKRIEPVDVNKFSFYTVGKKIAQDMLTTDWRVLLDIDEFLYDRIDTGGLDKRYAYPLRYHHLYGNSHTEIRNNGFPVYQFRIHVDRREVVGDGASVSPPYCRYQFPVHQMVVSGEWFNRQFLLKNSTADNGHGSDKSGTQHVDNNKDSLIHKMFNKLKNIDKPVKFFEVYHTGSARNPVALKNKWRVQTEREINEGNTANMGRLKFLEDNKFDYAKYRDIWKNAYLKNIDEREIPLIIRNNADRFNWINFSDS